MLVLVFLVVVGVSGAAVLGLQSATFSAHAAVTNKATADISAENALNSSVQALRSDVTGQTGRDNGTLTAGCNHVGTPDVLAHYGEDGTDTHVQCVPVTGSGQRAGGTRVCRTR